MIVTTLTVALSATAGALAASLLACLPGLHIYNVMGLLLIGTHAAATRGLAPTPEIVLPFSMGLMVGYAILNTVPSVLLAAPDESALFTVLPGQKYLMQGHGYEAVLVTSLGGLAGLFLIVLGLGPLAPRLLPPLHRVLRPHTHWIVWCVIAFMLMSEWPKGGRLGGSGWRRFVDAWRSVGAGLLTFALSGLLGFVLYYRSPVRAGAAFQNLMPAFVGLFTLPWLIVNLVSRVEIPAQSRRCSFSLRSPALWHGALAGGLGGGFAAFFPVITGGVGGLLAGHATALRDDRAFLVSQGTSKLVYYAGGFLFFAVPGLYVTRGGGAWMVRGLVAPWTPAHYAMTVAAAAVGGTVAFLLVDPLARGTLALMRRFGYQRISACALAIVLGLVAAVTGLRGLLVMVVGAAIGLIPVLYGSRRMNCLGVILLPMACNMSGVGPAVARLLGLL